jgi:lipoprotein
VNGLKDSGYMGSAPVETATPASPVPTPNELAKPAQ